ncbi:hypothetical protein ABFB09_00395 [Dehalogenimonas sp. THU2]|uniref:hypothetical protein n=1 Tax=Dehalogenimonas sp. THU2 TaxID=3151121 RepID=UPI0032181D4C
MIVGIAILVWAYWPSPGPTVTVDPLITAPVPPPVSVTVPPVTSVPSSISINSPAPTQASTGFVSRSYKWNFKGAEWTWEFSVPQALYDYYKSLPRPPTENYSVYVTHPYDDPYIEALVAKIKEAAKTKGYSEYETIEFATAFVQSLPYTSDNVTTKFDEYPRYPIETLIDNGGDCEDTSILMASFIDVMNFGVVLLGFDAPAGSDSGHMAVGIKGGESVYGSYWEYTGSKYFYLETTGDNWGIGDIPVEYENRSAHIYPMAPVPILTHEWTGSGRGQYADLTISVSNFGSAEAKGVYVFTGFDAGNDMVRNSERSPVFDLGIGETATITITIRVPAGEHTRILVQIVYGGYAVDESFSDWVDT